MAQVMRYSSEDEARLMKEIWTPDIADNPLAFVLFAFPWGKKGTLLEKEIGPREWQREFLIEIAEHLKVNKDVDLPEMLRMATASGRGIGKTALETWLVLWFMSTRLGGTCFVSANSESQLKDVFWGELGKWYAILINRHWFEITATKLFPAKWFGDLITDQMGIGIEYYYAVQKLWSEENPTSYAGVHNPIGVLLLFDEASGIPAPIWDVAEGFFRESTLNRFWVTFSNPRTTSGAFFECFHKNREFWKLRNIDSRNVEGGDPAFYARIIKQNGEDSDQARVEVRGLFPRAGENQFIGYDIVDAAQERELVADEHAALIMGVDIARSGADECVVAFRRGRDARSIPMIAWHSTSDMDAAYRVAALIDKHKPDAVCIDAGSGTGVIDRLRELGYKVTEVWFGGKSDVPSFGNCRAMMWGRMREWLDGACLEVGNAIRDDLCGPMKDWTKNGDAILLESKKSMASRGLHSPDRGDALALTFKVRVSRKDSTTFRSRFEKATSRISGSVDSWLGS